MNHARPHLTTHARGKGHSAIAGVAYRLGLRLQDKRTGEWHDYRRSAVGEEIVAAFTLAPAGAPAWATDPAVVWDAVEVILPLLTRVRSRDYAAAISRCFGVMPPRPI